MTTANPRISVVIPSLDGHRNGCVSKLLASIERQTYRPDTIELVKAVSPQGRAINQGVARTDGEILIVMDDDAELADESVFERLVNTLIADPSIGMAGASIVIGPGASIFQRRAARQFPRLSTPVVEAITDSDMACHGCCAIPRAAFEAVGGEREDIPRGLDPDLRVRLRSAGYRVVLAPRTRIHHPLPDGWRPLLRTFFRNGFGSAYAQKYQPGTIYETHESLSSLRFQPRRTLIYRIARYPLRLAAALVTLRYMRFAAYCAYAAGYAWGIATAKPIAP